jgi:hypothetical protein
VPASAAGPSCLTALTASCARGVSPPIFFFSDAGRWMDTRVVEQARAGSACLLQRLNGGLDSGLIAVELHARCLCLRAGRRLPECHTRV